VSILVERYASPDSEPAAGEEYGGGDGSVPVLSVFLFPKSDCLYLVCRCDWEILL